MKETRRLEGSGPFSQRKAECWGGLELGLHTGQEPGASFLARNPHFSAGLGKQKSAQQKAARQPEGTQPLEGVGTSLMRWQ